MLQPLSSGGSSSACDQLRRRQRRRRAAVACASSPPDDGGSSDEASGLGGEGGAAESSPTSASGDSGSGLGVSASAALASRLAALRRREAARRGRVDAAWASGAPLATSVVANLGDWARRLRLAPDGATVAVGTFSGAVHVVALSGGRDPRAAVLRSTGLGQEISALAYDGCTLAAGGAGGAVALWRFGARADGSRGWVGGPLLASHHHRSPVTALCLLPCGGLMSACAGGELMLRSVSPPAAPSDAVAFAVSEPTVAALRPVSSGCVHGRYVALGHADGRVTLLALAPPGRALGGGGGGGGPSAPPAPTSLIPDPPAPPVTLLSFGAHAKAVTCVQVVRPGGEGAAGGALLDDAADAAGADAAAPPAAAAPVSAGLVLWTGGAEGGVRAWSLAAGGAPLASLAAHPGHGVTCLQADGAKLVTGGRDGVLRVFDAPAAAAAAAAAAGPAAAAAAAAPRLRFELGGRTPYLDDLQFRGSLLIATGCNNLVACHTLGDVEEGEDY